MTQSETRIDAHDVMLNLTEACVLMEHAPVELRVEHSAQIALILMEANASFKDVILFAFMTQTAALVLALADLRGETAAEGIANWRLSVISALHKHEHRE